MKTRTFIAASALILLFSVISASSGCKKSSDSVPGPGLNEVWIENFQFNPSVVNTTVNSTVQWINKDNSAHTATSDSAVFASPTLNAGTTFSYTFTKPGTYKYHCSFHSTMTGTVIVK
ncbi:MAG: cupredoxin domain-containing protein [Bacteroidetes bacterium]|nr:cupredoxin domain-containing protein [Bacteroidota bacterium]